MDRLSTDEQALVSRLQSMLASRREYDRRNERYYLGLQRLAVLGLAVPPELDGFETVVNWPRVTVDELERRLDLRAFVMPGSEEADPMLLDGWAYNDLQAQAPLLHRDALIYGRSYASISTNPNDADHPLVTPELPSQIVVDHDPATRTIRAALRLYRALDGLTTVTYGTLYMPGYTVWFQTSGGQWEVTDRDEHGLGHVPIVEFINRRRVGHWWGESEMADVIPITDAAARAMTDVQLATETIAVPKRYVLGVSKGDFVDEKGEQIPVWEAYMSSFITTQNTDAKIGQLDGAQLSNFTGLIDFYGRMVASVTGLPIRYFGQASGTAPTAEGAIRADESRLVKNAERKQDQFGVSWATAMAFYYRLASGEWPDGRISSLWFDAGTPTFSQKADALQKLAGGTPILSREGAWDELGWSEARKARERTYFEQQDSQPLAYGAQAALQLAQVPDDRTDDSAQSSPAA